MSTSWQLSSIWSWDETSPYEPVPLAVFLPIGLYGVYMAVFSLSLWTMFWDGKRFSGVRWVVVVTFLAVTMYMIATLVRYPMGELSDAHVPLFHFNAIAIVWHNMSPCVCCSLSDSVLAWRCYVIFGKRRWLKWTLTIVVLAITVLGTSSGMLDVSGDWDTFHGQYDGRPNTITLSGLAYWAPYPTTLSWAVLSLLLNTVLSTSIVAKIIIVSRQTNRHFASSRSIHLARAFIESSLMSWIALAVYTGLDVSLYASLYATADRRLRIDLPNLAVVHVAQGQNTLLLTILPLIFSISQALLIARLGVSRFAASTGFKDTIVALTSDDHDTSAPRSNAVAHQDVEP